MKSDRILAAVLGVVVLITVVIAHQLSVEAQDSARVISPPAARAGLPAAATAATVPAPAVALEAEKSRASGEASPVASLADEERPSETVLHSRGNDGQHAE